jgi:hypothetical protein
MEKLVAEKLALLDKQHTAVFVFRCNPAFAG